MNLRLSRRSFITCAATGIAAGASTTHSAGSAKSDNTQASDSAAAGPVRARSKGNVPTGRIGKLTVSRLISGGNLISGWAHSRDLHYVPSLMRAYNTEEKVLDTLQLMEEHGINTIIADPRKKPMDIFKRYWAERGGRIQWIAEGHPDVDDWKTNIEQSVEFGAAAVYVQGVIGDRWYKENRLDLLGDCVEFIKSLGVPAGIGAHKLEVIEESEKRGFNPDFYVKTLHHMNYWSARHSNETADVVDNKADHCCPN